MLDSVIPHRHRFLCSLLSKPRFLNTCEHTRSFSSLYKCKTNKQITPALSSLVPCKWSSLLQLYPSVPHEAVSLCSLTSLIITTSPCPHPLIMFCIISLYLIMIVFNVACCSHTNTVHSLNKPRSESLTSVFIIFIMRFRVKGFFSTAHKGLERSRVILMTPVLGFDRLETLCVQ